MRPKFIAKQREGKLIFKYPDKVSEYLRSLRDDLLTVVISKYKNTRSNNQNRYLWGVVYKLISDEIGYNPEETHELCKSLFLKERMEIRSKDDTIKTYTVLRSTASLKTDEMEEYLRRIREWASIEISCYIPLPNEVDY